MEVELVPLVENIELPIPAPAKTRMQIPSGYGIQEQCLPFTAATALGFLIGSPISFGFCSENEVPAGAHSFCSPLASGKVATPHNGKTPFYVKDEPECGFLKNAFYQVSATQEVRQIAPGISFFDREDQQDMFKVHLPYIWRTPSDVDALFLPAINRSNSGFTIQAGLVETDWYTNAVNLVLRKDSSTPALHVTRGEPIAQVVFINRAYLTPSLRVLPRHTEKARSILREQEDFFLRISENRSVYKKLARSHDGLVS